MEEVKQEEERKVKEEKLSSLSDAKYNDGAKKNLNNEIASIDKRIRESNQKTKI